MSFVSETLEEIHQLPPCKVCGQHASGFHYGVNTCDACKAFFQRSIRRRAKYDCNNRKISSESKKLSCRHCRYEKCLSAGMSVDGIKIGRYTSKKKAEDLLERQQLLSEQEQQQEQEEEEEQQQQPDEAEQCDVSKEDNIETDEQTMSEQELQQLIDVIVQAQHQQVPYITKHLQELPDIQHAFVESGHQHSDMCSCGVDVPGHVASTDCSSTSRVQHKATHQSQESFSFRVSSPVARIFEMAAKDLSEVSHHGNQVDVTNDVMTDVTDVQTTTVASSIDSLLLNSCQTKLVELLPRSWRISTEQNESDERRHVLCRWLVTLEKGLRGIVGFVKQVPGFDQLPTNDKINIVKRSICESWLVTRHRAFNRDLGCYTAYNGFTFDLVKAVGEQFSSVLFSAAVRMQALRLTDEETFLVKAFVFFFTDGIELEDPVQVEIIQRRLLLALKYLLARSHSDDPLIVARLIGAITELRNVTDSFRRLW